MLSEPEVLRAWLRDVQGHNNVESYKAQVLNRRTGSMEERQFVWVCKGARRSKKEENRNTRSSTLSKSSHEFTTAQVQDAQMRVAALVTWSYFGDAVILEENQIQRHIETRGVNGLNQWTYGIWQIYLACAFFGLESGSKRSLR